MSNLDMTVLLTTAVIVSRYFMLC